MRIRIGHSQSCRRSFFSAPAKLGSIHPHAMHDDRQPSRHSDDCALHPTMPDWLKMKNADAPAVKARSRGGLGQMTATSLNFALLDANRSEVARLIAAMVQARDAVEHRSWSHPQEPSGEEWWADVLADPRARKRGRRTDLPTRELPVS